MESDPFLNRLRGLEGTGTSKVTPHPPTLRVTQTHNGLSESERFGVSPLTGEVLQNPQGFV